MNFSQEISKLISWDLSLIPASEDGDKRALVKWKDKPPLKLEAILDFCDRKGNYSVAVKTGEHGRIICIDIDTKYNAGFDVILLGHLEGRYADVLERCLIEKTPSGGYHIFFRVSGIEPLPVYPKLASREPSDREKEVEGEKASNKCFLELKSVGGLAHIYPSEGYVRVSGGLDAGVEISYQECMTLINVCKSYNEVSVVEKKIRPTKDLDFYKKGENPYECFDASDEGGKVLGEFGWTYVNSWGEYDYYSKPEKGDKGVSASYHRKLCFYKIFTTSTVLEAGKVYSPSNLLCKLKFDSASGKSELYHYLVAKGYGKIEPKFERNIVKRRAAKGEPLPANASDEAQWDYEIELRKGKELHPHGIFWKADEKGVKIIREDLYRVSKELGFRKYRQEPVRIEGYVIRKIKDENYYNEIKKYIALDDAEVLSAYEQFLQNSGKFTISRLEDLDEELIMKSSKMVSYKFYKNVYIKIESDDIELRKYDDMEKLIWEDSIKKRDFKLLDEEVYKDSLYYRYLNNSMHFDQKRDYISKCIGYYAHDYRDEEGYFCIAMEECENPEDGGGSGKNIFWNLFSLITTFKSTPASLVKKDNALFQSWNYERMFILADMPKDYELIFFKDIITGNAVVRKLYQDEYHVDIEDMPKLGGSTNYSWDDTDAGVKRRVRGIEFTDFYTRAGGVNTFHRKMFPKDWDGMDYLTFDNIMIDCIQRFLKAEGKINKEELTEGGWVKQFSLKYKHLYDFIKQHINEWCALGKIDDGFFKTQYNKFKEENNVKFGGYTITVVNNAITSYCSNHKIEFVKSKTWKDGGLTMRGKVFGEFKEEIEEEVPF